MPRKTLSPDTWDEIGHHWRAGRITVRDLARRYAISTTAIYTKARRADWPPRHKPDNSPQAAREALLADLTVELRQSLSQLRAEPPADTPASARDRTRLIREYQRTLAALVLTPASKTAATPETLTLDLEAAKREVLDRLKRLDRTEPPPLEDPATDPAVDPPGSP